MGRWKDLDTDADRLPENMTRIGYDADTQVYTYRDNTDGSIWEGAPGATYGKLFPVKPPTPLPSVEVPEIDGTEPGYVLEEGPDHDPFGDHNAVRGDDEKKPKRGYSTRKRVDSVMDRIASVREKKPDRRPSRRESRRERGDAAGYGDEKGLERKNTKKERDGHRYSEKETLSRSSTTRTSRTGSTPSWDPRPSPPQPQQDGSSKLKRAGTLSRLSRFLTGKRKEDDPDYDVTPGTGSGNGGWNANGSRVHRSATVSARSRTQPQTGRRQRATSTTFDDILAGIPGQH